MIKKLTCLSFLVVLFGILTYPLMSVNARSILLNKEHITSKISTELGDSILENGMRYTPDNRAHDPLEGGTLEISRKLQVPGISISWVEFHLLVPFYKMGFRLTWSMPEGIEPQQFINAINIKKTAVRLSGQNCPIRDKSGFMIDKNNNTVYLDVNDKYLDLLAIIKYIVKWVNGTPADIQSTVVLDINKLSVNFPHDFSNNHIVTNNKLTPNDKNVLTSTTRFYDKNGKMGDEKTFSVPTWKNYISPWNKEKADSQENGKFDDTQTDSSHEVFGENRVLKGNDYKSRIVNLPITETLKPSEYIRVINLFTKFVIPNPRINIGNPIVSDIITKHGDTTFLNRSTAYYYRGDDLISPVPINFRQNSHLKFTVNGGGEYPEYDEIPIKGSVDTEGNVVKYFFSIDYGVEQLLDNKSKDSKKLDAGIKNLKAGDHTITVKAVNEFGLSNKCDFKVTIYAGCLSLQSVPDSISFGSSLKLSPETLNLKAINLGDLVVSDTRDAVRKTSWVLSLKETKPLIDSESKLTYTNRDNNQITVNSDNQAIESNLKNKPTEDKISTYWEKENHGLFLTVQPESQKIGSYSGELTWTLQDTPNAK